MILLVENDEDDIFSFRRALRRIGLDSQLLFVKDGNKAIAYFSGDGEYANRTLHPIPDLVFLDLNLPYRDGFEVIAWLRASSDPQIFKIPVVILSGSREPKDFETAKILGAAQYLVKPADFEGVREAILNIVPDLLAG